MKSYIQELELIEFVLKKQFFSIDDNFSLIKFCTKTIRNEKVHQKFLI